MAGPFTAPVQALLDAFPDPVILLDAGRGVARAKAAAARRAWRSPRNACPTWCCSIGCALRGKPAPRRIPVIMLTARGEAADKIRGLDSGADDDITKPFSPAELSARVGAILWRSKPSGAEQRLE